MSRKSSTSEAAAPSVVAGKVKKAIVKAKPKLDLKKLRKSLGKKFPDPIKTALVAGCGYQIVNARAETTKFGDILIVDVAALKAGGSIIQTYFSSLHTQQLVGKVSCQSIDLLKYPEVIVGFTFVYRGEIVSQKGHSYSDIDFCDGGGSSDED